MSSKDDEVLRRIEELEAKGILPLKRSADKPLVMEEEPCPFCGNRLGKGYVSCHRNRTDYAFCHKDCVPLGWTLMP